MVVSLRSLQHPQRNHHRRQKHQPTRAQKIYSPRSKKNEVQTVGMPPDAMAGFLFHPTQVVRDWDSAQKDFQNLADRTDDDFSDRTFPTFSYETRMNPNRADWIHEGDISFPSESEK